RARPARADVRQRANLLAHGRARRGHAHRDTRAAAPGRVLGRRDMTIRTLIVDDEPLAREGVALALAHERGIEIVGSCGDGPSAVRAIRDLKPDLVFLDVNMPGLDGFAVIGEIGADDMPAVIFLTAYEEHALRAFRVNAVDYLLKPIDADDL